MEETPTRSNTGYIVAGSTFTVAPNSSRKAAQKTVQAVQEAPEKPQEDIEEPSVPQDATQVPNEPQEPAQERVESETQDAANLPEQNAAVEESEDGEETPDILSNGWEVDTEGGDYPILFLNQNERALAALPLPQSIMRDLLADLNDSYIMPEDEPTAWQVRVPDMIGAPPVLSFTRGGTILGSVPMDEDFGRKLGPMLTALYPMEPKVKVPVHKLLRRWARKHKFLTFVTAVVILPVLYFTIAGLFHTF